MSGDVIRSESSSFTVEKTGHVAAGAEQARAAQHHDARILQEIRSRSELTRTRRPRVVIRPGKVTAGLDLTAAQALLGDGSSAYRDRLYRKILELQASMTAIEKCRKPVIAAIHGHCIGGGVDMTCACDIRIAARDAVFSIRETRLGIIADIGTLQCLLHIVGRGGSEPALTGRD